MRAFWLLVLPLLAFAGYLAVRVTRESDTLRRHELQALLDSRLADVRTRASHAMGSLERQLTDQLAAAPSTPDELRALERTIPLANAIFRLDREGQLQFPKAGRDASAAEREFLDRTAEIWHGRAILTAGTHHEGARGKARGTGDSFVGLAAQDDHGWISWYWAEGLHLLFWRRAADGGVIGVELERIGVMARVVGAMPTNVEHSGEAGPLDAMTRGEDGRVELADSRGETVYQWGALMPADDAPPARPDSSLALEQPLDSWQLRYFLAPQQREALVGSTDLGTLFGLGALGLAVLALALYIYREYTRRLREAARRVGFVTRVSHELRTPLANIRMYGELLEDASDDDPDQLRRARVIVSESERLGRLIDNVLAFGRPRRAEAPVSVDVNSAVRETVAKFEPALASRAIEVRLELAERAVARAGSGAVEQIVTNLMSNVEKYAPGGDVTVSTRRENGHVVVAIADHGPGVIAGEREKIFEPFHRASDALTDRTSGTGIGLAIARDLARAAGGDLVLADAERGARFELTLPAGDES